MSYRKLPRGRHRARDQTRDLVDRVDRVQAGSVLKGRASFGPAIDIGGVTVTVEGGPAGAKNLVFTNPATGISYTINL